jgi:predicted transcriptional regulator
MIYSEFKRHLGKAGLTVNEFAALLHLQPSSVSNYAKKIAVPQTHAVIAVALGDAADRGVDFRETLARYGLRFQNRARTKSKVVAELSDYRGKSNRREGK